MTEPPSPDRSKALEQEWARGRIRPWLLGRLSEMEEDRFDEAASLSGDIPYEVAEAEEALISEYIDGRLPGEDRDDFARIYLFGPEYKQAKVRVQRALNAERVRKITTAPAQEPLPEQRRSPILDFLLGRRLVPALLLLVLLSAGAAFYWQWRIRSDLRHQVVRIPTEEQPAGEARDRGLVLDASSPAGSTKLVEDVPVRITWIVPDYRIPYRVRVVANSGAELISAVIKPQDNAVSFSIDNTTSLPLPWDVFLLRAADNAVESHYKVTRQ